MAAASEESPPAHSARQLLPTAARSPLHNYEDMEEETTHYYPPATDPSMPSVEEENLRMESLSTSKNQSSQKLVPVQRARPTSQAAAKIVKIRKRKLTDECRTSGFFHEFVLMQSKLKELAGHSDAIIAAMAERMKKKFSKYWEDKDDLNNLLFIALVMDPRYKVKFLSFFFLGIYGAEKKNKLVGKIESDLRRLFDYYVESAAYASSNTNYNQPPLLINLDEHEENPSMLLASQFTMHLEEIETRESNSELSRYLAENCEKITDDFDLLIRWRCNSNKYPILSKLPKDILAVPISTVASESSFSTGGRILDSFRTSLSATTVEALICTQSWLRSPSDPIVVMEAMEEVEAYEEIQEELLADNSMSK